MASKRTPCSIARRRATRATPLSQLELAEIIGCDRGNLSRYETGAVIPALPMAIRIAQALGVSVESLWSELAESSREQVLVRLRDRGLLPGYEPLVQEGADN